MLYSFMAISLIAGSFAAYKTIDLMNRATQVMLTATGQ
jgi:hypothetical protein